MRHKLSGIVLLLTLLATPSAMQAQKDRFDKKNADEFVYEQLSKNTGGEDFCKKLILNKQNLADTNEERIKLLRGKSFQINRCVLTCSSMQKHGSRCSTIVILWSRR